MLLRLWKNMYKTEPKEQQLQGIKSHTNRHATRDRYTFLTTLRSQPLTPKVHDQKSYYIYIYYM